MPLYETKVCDSVTDVDVPTSLWHRLQLIDPSSNILLILSPTLRLQILHPSLCFPHPPLRPGIHLIPIPIS
jgi:hypothetical protein